MHAYSTFMIPWLVSKEMILFVFRAEAHAGFYDEPELWVRELELLNVWEDHASKERHAETLWNACGHGHGMSTLPEEF